MPAPAAPLAPRTIGRYLLSAPIAVGGMASVHFGKLNGPVGFRRTVAIKRMLQSYASNAEARLMLIDEARLAARVNHANVVQTLDVVEHGDELFLVMDYVHGESLDQLLERARELERRVPPRVATAVLVGVLEGLHAAHEAKGEDGQPLELVHRDLSPHNVLVDVNGVARVLDFGVARARGRLQGTRDGQLKGKLAYLAPEQVHGDSSRRSDLFTAGVVLWECLAGRRLFVGESEAEVLSQVLRCQVPSLADEGVEAPGAQAVLDRALAREPQQRFATAHEMAEALGACGAAGAQEVAAWVMELAADALAERARFLEALDRAPAGPTAEPGPAAVAGPSAPAPPAVAARPSSSPVRVGVLVAVILAALASVLWRSQNPAPGPSPEPVVSPSPVPVVSPTPAVFAPLPPAVVEPVAIAPAAVDAGLAAKPEHGLTRSKACDPPYTFDAHGVKRYKVSCLK